MARSLITGGAGFIGSHTTRALLDMGEEVTIYDIFYQYKVPFHPTFLENMNYRFLHLLKDARIIRGSTENKDALRRQIAEFRPDHVIHLAALSLANVALMETEEAFGSIVQGTMNVLEILRDMGCVQKFVYVSSSMIYGDFKRVPITEDEVKDPKDIYGGMKLAGEILVKVFAKRHGIPYVIVRPSAVYGPADNNRRVLQVFVESAMRGEPITVTKADETTYLDFTYVTDTAHGLALAALSPDAVNEEFNITAGHGRSVAEAVAILRGLFPEMEVRLKPNFEAWRPARGTLDITKACQQLGYRPRYALEEGIEEYIAFAREHNPGLSRLRAVPRPVVVSSEGGPRVA